MIEIPLVKAFTQNKDLGNPAGVIFDAENLTEEQRIHIAGTLGFSESAFVSGSDSADFKVDFYTPTQRVALCGHASIATFYALVQEGKITFDDSEEVEVTQETQAGILKVRCRKDGLISMEQSKPVFHPENAYSIEEIAKLLGISSSDINGPIQLVSTGSPKLIIPVTSLQVLESVKPDLEAMVEFCQKTEVRGFYPFTTETKEGSDFHARQFNPFAGINEDPITGVAAGALGAYAVKHNLLNKNTLVIEQGYVMNKGGKMYVTVDGDKVTVGGYATIFDKEQIDIS